MTSTAVENSPSLSSLATPSVELAQMLCRKIDLIEKALIDLRHELEQSSGLVPPGPIRTRGTATSAKDEPVCNGISAKDQDVTPRQVLPHNVVPVGRARFLSPSRKPAEADIDPVLARATVDELNAALAAAFNQMSAS